MNGDQSTMKGFEQMYPYIAAWVQDGYVEVGNDGYSRSFLRVLDEGGQIWESSEEYLSLDEALAAMDTAIANWCQVHIPDIDIGGGDGYSFTPKQGQYLAFIYNYTQIHGRSPAEADLQQFFGTTPPTIHQMILKLEQLGLITLGPGEPRSAQVVIPARFLPTLERPDRK
jgi:repressor LexA